MLLHIEIPTPEYCAQPGLAAVPALPEHLAGTLSSQPASAAEPPSLVLRAWKISKRFEDDISAVCLALRLEIQNKRIVSASIGVGGVAATPMRAIKTEAALAGRACTQATFEAAIEVLRSEFTPISDLRASAAYRRSVTGGNT